MNFHSFRTKIINSTCSILNVVQWTSSEMRTAYGNGCDDASAHFHWNAQNVFNNHMKRDLIYSINSDIYINNDTTSVTERSPAHCEHRNQYRCSHIKEFNANPFNGRTNWNHLPHLLRCVQRIEQYSTLMKIWNLGKSRWKKMYWKFNLLPSIGGIICVKSTETVRYSMLNKCWGLLASTKH